MEKNIYLYLRLVGLKFDLLNHVFKLEFADSGLYFVKDENNLIYWFLQVVSGSGEKVTDPAGQKSTDPHPWIEYSVSERANHFCSDI